MYKFAKHLAGASVIALLAAGASAQEIQVETLDGSVKVVGNLVSFDTEFLVIDTVFGQLQLPRASSTCLGDACPIDTPTLDLAVAVDDEFVGSLMHSLIMGYAGLEEMTAAPQANSAAPVDNLVLTSLATGDDAGAITFSRDAGAEGYNSLANGNLTMKVSFNSPSAAVVNQALSSNGLDFLSPENERVIALSAIVPVVNGNNNLKSISLQELAQIAGGRITNWSELGGDDAPINVILPAEGSTIDAAVSELILDPNRIRLRRSINRADSVQTALSAVEGDANAIAFATVGNTGAAAALPIRQTCGPVAHATDFAIKAEEYPLTKRVYAYANAAQLASTGANFLDYLTSDFAQQQVTASGYVDQTVDLQSISLQGTRMNAAILSAGSAETLTLVQRLAGDLATAERLSTTFRFAVGSSELDSKALADVQRVSAFLNSPAARNRDILVIGFTDDVGRFDLNERLSLSRAASVSDALVTAIGGEALAERIDVSSYGPLAPVGCNDTAVGRESNRRVEIWLR